jgi:chaperone required for assembly of F1-ATPase
MTHCYSRMRGAALRSSYSATRSGIIISYRDENPKLREQQDQYFGEVYQLLKSNLGYDVCTYTNMFTHENERNIPKLRNDLKDLSAEKLVCLELAASYFKSTSLALLMLNSVIPAKRAFDLSRLEEQFQYEQYGKIEEHHSFDESQLFMQILAIKLFWKFQVNN